MLQVSKPTYLIDPLQQLMSIKITSSWSRRRFLWSIFLNVCLSDPTSSPRSPNWSGSCVPSYTLSSPAFKWVTRGMSFIIKCENKVIWHPLKVRSDFLGTSEIAVIIQPLLFIIKCENKVIQHPLKVRSDFLGTSMIRTHDFSIMRQTHCQLRHCNSYFIKG